MKNFGFLIEYWLIRTASWIVCLIPFRWALAIARPIGHILFTVLKRPRKMAHQNLKHAFPEKNPQEIEAIEKESFVHLAEFGIEWLKMPEMIARPERYLIDQVEGKDKVMEALKQKKGVLMLVTHTANWEVMALLMGRAFAPVNDSVCALARPFKNTYLYNYAMKMRGGHGLKSIGKGGGVRETFDRLRKDNAVMCMLIDQRVSEGSIETDFFGRPALTTSLPAIAALRLATPVFFSFLYQTPDLKYRLKLEGPVVLEKTGDYKKDIQMNTQKFAARVEEEIRKNPPHWLWMHNRWRVAHGPK